MGRNSDREHGAMYAQISEHLCYLLQNLLVRDLAVLIDLVDNRHARSKLRLDDLIARHLLEIHDQCTQRVAVSRHKDRLACFDRGQNVFPVIRQNTVGRQLEGLATRRAHIERTAPFVHLLLTPLLARIVLVQSRELAVVTLIQGLILCHWDALLTNGLQLDLKGLLRTLKIRRERLTDSVSIHAFPKRL